MMNTGTSVPNCICKCFLEKNYYLRKFNLHLDYFGESHVSDKMEKVLLQQNVPIKDFDDILEELQAERKRRTNLAVESFDRMTQVKQKYVPLHSQLYILQESYFHRDFLKLVDYAKLATATQQGLIEKMETCCKSVWKFPVFTQQFCDDFLEELSNFQLSDLPKGRPNTMNHFGVLLDEAGFDELFLDPLRLNYLSPLAQLLLPEWHGRALDSHKAFTVSYKENADVALSYHFDNAEITLNVCLGKEFEEGELYFGDMKTEPSNLLNAKKVEHKIGYGILHRGQHMHGAMPINGRDAERHNLIIWMRSSSIRNNLCPMCGLKPTLIGQVYGGDGFTLDETNSAVDSKKNDRTLAFCAAL